MEPYLITPESLAVLGALIPREYQEEIVTGDLIGIVMEDLGHDHEIVAVVLLRERNGWMEIVWICLTDAYRGMYVVEDVIRYCVETARKNGKAWGVFANLPTGGRLEEVMREAFQFEGFSFVPVDHHCYTTTFGAMRKQPHFERLLQGKPAKNTVFLERADELLRKRLSAAVQNSIEPVPLALPIDFSRYDQRLSCIHRQDATTPDAFLLLARQQDHLTVECMWSENPKVLPALLGSVVRKAQEFCADDTQIVVPTVTERSAELARKLFPDAEPLQGMQARLFFTSDKEETLWEAM